MVKLNQIVAVVNGKKTEAQKALTEVHRKCGQAELFNGINRTYKPLNDDGETFPDENKEVQYSTEQALLDCKEILTGLFDVVATQDYANGSAVADITVDGKIILQNVPVTYLLFLEKQLVDVNTFVSKLPVLDPAETWDKDQNKDVFVSKSYETNKTKKTLQHKVLYEATKEHPANVEKWTEDVVVGRYATKKFSGAMPARERKLMLEKVRKLQDAVKFARETANSLEIQQIKIGDNIFNYLLS